MAQKHLAHSFRWYRDSGIICDHDLLNDPPHATGQSRQVQQVHFGRLSEPTSLIRTPKP